MKYSGIDPHPNNSVVAVMDGEDGVVAEKRLPGDLAKIPGLLAPWRDELAGVAVGSTFNGYWPVDGLQAAGFKVHLANTTAIKKYEGLKHSGDETDARRQGARISSNRAKRLTAEAIGRMPLPEGVAPAPKTNVAVIATLSRQIDLLEKRPQEKVGEQSGYGLLASAPGIGRVSATAILPETGPIDRFAAAGNFAPHARCVDSVRASNGKKKGEGNTKNGNKHLAWAFVEAADFAPRCCPGAKRFYERKKAGTDNVAAAGAPAHKLARACFRILEGRKPFDMARRFV